MSEHDATEPPPNVLQQLGYDTVIEIAETVLGKSTTSHQREALRRVVADGRVVAGRRSGAIPASELIALDRANVLRILDEPGPKTAMPSMKFAVACRREWLRRGDPLASIPAVSPSDISRHLALLTSTAPAPFDQRAYHRRIGIVTGLAEKHHPDMLSSRARQIARTWRSCLAYRLSVALGPAWGGHRWPWEK